MQLESLRVSRDAERDELMHTISTLRTEIASLQDELHRRSQALPSSGRHNSSQQIAGTDDHLRSGSLSNALTVVSSVNGRNIGSANESSSWFSLIQYLLPGNLLAKPARHNTVSSDLLHV
jgi:hypothetical protein